MPPKLSARQIFWTGIILTVIGVLVQNYLPIVLHDIWGDSALNTAAFSALTGIVGPVAFPLGTAVIAYSLLARVIESDARPVPGPKTGWLPSPPKLSARQLVWTGLVLLVIGVILSSRLLDSVFSELSGSLDVAANLARDLLFLVVPLASIALPLGIAILPCSVVVRMLEERARDRRSRTTEVLSRP